MKTRPLHTTLLFALLAFGTLCAKESDHYHKLPIDAATIAANNLCRLCHKPTEADLEKLSSATESASLIEGSLRERASYVCMSCHDGVHSAINIVPQNLLLQGSGCENSPDTRMRHPVFVPYDSYAEAFNPAWSILPGSWSDAEKVSDLLVDGEVVCISCHDSHSAKPKAADGMGTLCIGCHNK